MVIPNLHLEHHIPDGFPCEVLWRPEALDGSLHTKILPTKTRWLKISGEIPTDLRIPTLATKFMLESNSLKSRILVRRLAVQRKREETWLLSRATAAAIHVRALPSFQQPTFQRLTNHQWFSYSQFKCFSSFQINLWNVGRWNYR